MTHKSTDFREFVFDHGRSFERKTPGNNRDIFRETHRQKHFRAEHTRVADFEPFAETIVVSKYFHGRFGVRVVSRFEAKVGETELGEEFADDANEMTQIEVAIGDKTFDLMKLGKMGGIEGFVTIDFVDGKVFFRGECAGVDIFLAESVEHAGTDGSGVGAKDI